MSWVSRPEPWQAAYLNRWGYYRYDKGMAKAYQVKQVLKAIERLEEETHVKG